MQNFTLDKAVLLAFYKFDKQERLGWFTKQFCRYFKKDISQQTVLYEVSKYRNIDPANNMSKVDMPQEYFDVWRYYIFEDRIDELKDIYIKFKKREYVEFSQTDKGKKFVDYIINDKPINKPLIIEITESKVQRDNNVLERALAYASYNCELDCSNKLFVRKSGDCLYTEGHHLIPLKYQCEFDYSLDVEANIVSLCPICHRQLHYGLENKDKLILLYEKRIERLEKCKISVSLEKLLSMYD